MLSTSNEARASVMPERRPVSTEKFLSGSFQGKVEAAEVRSKGPQPEARRLRPKAETGVGSWEI